MEWRKCDCAHVKLQTIIRNNIFPASAHTDKMLYFEIISFTSLVKIIERLQFPFKCINGFFFSFFFFFPKEIKAIFCAAGGYIYMKSWFYTSASFRSDKTVYWPKYYNECICVSGTRKPHSTSECHDNCDLLRSCSFISESIHHTADSSPSSSIRNVHSIVWKY